MRRTFAALFATAALGLAAPALAQPVSVPIDHSVRLSVGAPVASVVVGNPSVADVTVVDSRTVFVSGKTYGATDVVLLDGTGRTVYSADVTVTSPASEVSVYRGAQRTELACAPGCAAVMRTGAGAGASSGMPGRP